MTIRKNWHRHCSRDILMMLYDGEFFRIERGSWRVQAQIAAGGDPVARLKVVVMPEYKISTTEERLLIQKL